MEDVKINIKEYIKISLVHRLKDQVIQIKYPEVNSKNLPGVLKQISQIIKTKELVEKSLLKEDIDTAIKACSEDSTATHAGFVPLLKDVKEYLKALKAKKKGKKGEKKEPDFTMKLF